MSFQHLEKTLSSLLETHTLEEILSVLHAYASDRAVRKQTPAIAKWNEQAEAIELACDALDSQTNDSYYLVY